MNLREELRLLVKMIKDNSKANGAPLRNLDIAERLNYNKDYFATLTGNTGTVTEDHIRDIKKEFKAELENLSRSKPGEPINPPMALMLAMLDDYAHWKAEKEGIDFLVVKREIQKKANLISAGLEGWLPQV